MEEKRSNWFERVLDIRDVRYFLPATAGDPIPVLEDIPSGAKTDPQATGYDYTAAARATGHPKARQAKVTQLLLSRPQHNFGLSRRVVAPTSIWSPTRTKFHGRYNEIRKISLRRD